MAQRYVLEYSSGLKKKDFASEDEYFLERFKKGMEVGYSFDQCQGHVMQDLANALDISHLGPFFTEPECLIPTSE